MILNYTTKIDAFKTIGEIQSMLAKRKAKEVLIQYNDGLPTALMFSVEIGGEMFRYSLPCRWSAIHKILQREVRESRYKTESHAINVGWRVIKDWIEAQLALIDTGMVDIGEVFLPYQLQEGATTVYEKMKQVRLIGGGTNP